MQITVRRNISIYRAIYEALDIGPGPKSVYNQDMRLRSLFCILTLLTPLFVLAFGDKEPGQGPVILNENPLTIQSATLTQSELQPGGMTELKIVFELDQGHHAYLDQFKLEVVEPQDVFVTEFQIFPLTEFKDPVTKKIKKGAKGITELQTLVQLPSDIRAGKKEVLLNFTYQACAADYCLFPKKVPVEFSLVVTGGGETLFMETLNKGWLYALFFVFIAGILTSLTPCIFPLIPITLAVIGSTETQGSKLKGFIISSSYVLGIAITYSILGVVAAKTGALFGALLGHPVVVGIIALLFVIMGLSMYGLFEIKIPDKWATKIGSTKTNKGILGAFISGLIAGVVASPCVGPVLVSILAYVAQTQDVFIGFVLLFTFAIGLGQLFLVLGTFSSLLDKLPKSGPWMENVKFIFGTTMIAMALFYVHPVAHSTLFDGLVATSFILIATFFGAFDQLNKLGKAGTVRKGAMIVLFMLGWVFAIKALLPQHIEKELFPAMAKIEDSYAKPDWVTYSEQTLQKAREEGRPVIVDFKADWCLACKELEIYTFSDPRVMEVGKQFIWMEFEATNPSDELDKLKKEYDIKGLPFVMIFDTDGKWRTDLTLTGFEEADLFLERIKKAL